MAQLKYQNNFSSLYFGVDIEQLDNSRLNVNVGGDGFCERVLRYRSLTITYRRQVEISSERR